MGSERVSPPLDPHDQIAVDGLRRALGDRIAVYRFGSSANGDTHRHSDLDFGGARAEAPKPTARFDLQELVAAHLGRDVELRPSERGAARYSRPRRCRRDGLWRMTSSSTKRRQSERAVRRVREEHAGDDRNLLENQTKQDAIILNLQRACETSIDARGTNLGRVAHVGELRVECEALPCPPREAAADRERGPILRDSA